mmetsp:Transcript_71941/g.83595  ORF Transcript_71941/g.83595 Transcript_71941/m.83595 type:complete len:567 (+) Transcript_71941:105-1805(+)
MELSRHPWSGLYTLQFSHMPMSDDTSQPSASGDVSPPEDETPEGKQQAIRKMCASQFSEWYLLCRLIVEGELGRIKGSVKVKNSHLNSTEGGSSSGSRACLMPECQLLQGCDEVRLAIHFDRLDGFVVGQKQDLNNVIVRCDGSLSKDWHVGTVTLVLSNNNTLKLPRRMRFLLRPVTSPRCTHCLDPVQTVGYTCTSCGAVEYCSRHCQDAHAVGHAPICPTLKLYTSPKCGRVCTVFAGVEFVVHWRCTEATSFELLVDYSNPSGRAFIVSLNTLVDAREGLSYRLLPHQGSSAKDDGPQPTDHTIHELCVSIFHSVAQGAMDDGCIPLAAACLNHLFVFCETVESIMPIYIHYYHACIGEQFEGVRHICSLAEYVVLIRPMHECAQSLIEWALKAPVALFFWQRIKLAKEILINQYNLNSSVSFAPAIQVMKPMLIPDQQRQTLQLLAKVFILMATRAPKEMSQKMLRRAEECFKDSIDDDRSRNDFANMAQTYMQLAALYLMFEDPKLQAKSAPSKESGIEALQKAQQQLQQVHSAAIPQHIDGVAKQTQPQVTAQQAIRSR